MDALPWLFCSSSDFTGKVIVAFHTWQIKSGLDLEWKLIRGHLTVVFCSSSDFTGKVIMTFHT